MDLLLIAVAVVVVIVVVSALARRLGIAAPLLLIVAGVGVSFLPQVAAITVPPEIILAVVLPPLLYSTAVGLPTMEFRRDFTAIGGLSVLLVVVTALLLGLVFSAVIPGMSYAGGVALGAIVSPTDAVATAIARRLGAPPRVLTVLEGEGLLNDASALVLLRSAVAATAATVSIVGAVGDFVRAVAIAVAIGGAVGWLGLRARRKVGGAALSTALSFVVPFLAYLPVEALDASGLVAVVTAGLVTGVGSARYLRPQDRISERTNWRTVETLLEGGLFLVMGLELFGLVQDVHADGESGWAAAGVAALAAVAILLVRAAYLAPLLWSLARRARRGEATRGNVEQMRDRVEQHLAAGGQLRRVEQMRQAITRRLADIDYLAARPLGPREGVLLVWAGMRGVVTLAAAQSLPLDFPHRSFVVLVAFGVAAGTLLVQGGTLPWVVRRLGLTVAASASPSADIEGLLGLRRAVAVAASELLAAAPARPDGTAYDAEVVARVRDDVVGDERVLDAEELPTPHRREQYRELRLRVIEAQRSVVLAARSDGGHDSGQLARALELLDLEQIMVEMRTALPDS